MVWKLPAPKCFFAAASTSADDHDCQIAFLFTRGSLYFVEHCPPDKFFRLENFIIQLVRFKLSCVIATGARKPDIIARLAARDSGLR